MDYEESESASLFCTDFAEILLFDMRIVNSDRESVSYHNYEYGHKNSKNYIVGFL